MMRTNEMTEAMPKAITLGGIAPSMFCVDVESEWWWWWWWCCSDQNVADTITAAKERLAEEGVKVP